MAEMYCVRCGSVGHPKRYTRGSFLIELVLWLCFIVPGVLYSLWRLSTRVSVCRACGATEIIPPDSPRAKQLQAR